MTDCTQETWQPIKTAPWQTVVEVRNPQMSQPCLATRGYGTENGVHPDDTFFTSVYTPGRLGFPSGRLVCPTEWRLAPTGAPDMLPRSNKEIEQVQAETGFAPLQALRHWRMMRGGDRGVQPFPFDERRHGRRGR